MGGSRSGQQAERREAAERQDARGNAWLQAVLCEIAWANARSQTSYIDAQFRRLTRRRGVYKALIAVGHSLLVIIYHVLKTKRPFQELGSRLLRQTGAGTAAASSGSPA